MIRIHLFVSGRVQGVNFRSEIRRKARELSLTGWVRNLRDGRVEIKAEGSEESAEGLIEWIERDPYPARVSDVKMEREEYQGEFKNFKIIY